MSTAALHVNAAETNKTAVHFNELPSIAFFMRRLLLLEIEGRLARLSVGEKTQVVTCTKPSFPAITICATKVQSQRRQTGELYDTA
jgi:hypothetical protein